jgi:acyl-coenzyme A synthetase/AMP-(fatty) acid ligase
MAPHPKFPLLFVNRGFTTRIVQLKRDESAAVLEMLYRQIETPELHRRFKWTLVAELPKTATGKVQKFVLRGGKAGIARQ